MGMIKTLTALTVGSLVLVGCGQKETIREVLVTTPPVAATEAPDTDINKFDAYLEMLYAESAQARTWLESDLLELGTTVCEVFDQGGTIDGVINIFTKNSTGKYDDELYSAVIAGSVIHLCPEWADYVQSQLN
jgi:hypothetical protein